MRPVAFYAPMKPPTHPTPSGDRQMARALMAALSNGPQIDLVSELRIYDGAGDADVQKALQQQAKAEADRLIKLAAHRNWQAWISYHNYYKAPDIIGPVCAMWLRRTGCVRRALGRRQSHTPLMRFCCRKTCANRALKSAGHILPIATFWEQQPKRFGTTSGRKSTLPDVLIFNAVSFADAADPSASSPALRSSARQQTGSGRSQ